ncbi:MAG: EAL domain-containing protein [Gemmatimonadaceae bacterium]|nr:EAL domain-containing protein [Acetobacteraceae bacterium]
MAMLFAVGLAVLDMRTSRLDDARRSTSDLGRVLAEQSTRSFHAVDLVLQDTADRLQSTAPGSAEAFGARMASEDVHILLRERLRSLPQAEAISVVDRQGRVMNHTRSWPARPVVVSDRDYFENLRDNDSDAAFFSTSVRNRVSGLWTMYVGRRMNDAAGQFAGLATGALSVSYIEDFFGAVAVRPGGSVTLIRTTGQVLASYPHDEAGIGAPIPADAAWDDALQQGSGTYLSASEPDGLRRIVSVHRLGDMPLAVRVSLTEHAALTGWRQQAFGIMAGAMFAAVCLAVLLRLVVRQFDTLRLSRADLSQRNGELEQVRLRLESQAIDLAQTADALGASERREAENADTLQTTLENIDQGLMMVDSEHRVAVYNQRVLEMLELPSDLMKGRPRFDDVLAHQWQKNEFSTANQGVVGFVRSGGLVDEPHVYERTRPNGRVIEIRSRPLNGGGLVRTYTDVTERKAADARIRFIAHHDGLTMLANRVVLQDHLDQAVAACAASGHGLALLYIDLDRFKPINDTHGHAVGDQLLIEVASRMRGMVREEDLVARMGGDEFAIVQTAVGQPGSAASLAQRLIERMAEPFLFNGMRLTIGLSIGIGVYPTSGTVAAELRRNADIALYRAKESGRNTFQFFDAEMDRRQQARFQMEQDLRDAVAVNAFHLMYQPIWDVAADAVVGFETLLRWNHPIRGPVGPEEFVALAEANGLIVPLGSWVMETACAEASTWPEHLHLAVNLSPLQIRQGNLTDEVVGILKRTGLAAGRLELEVTEGVLLEDSGQVLQTMYSLQALGVSITLDDFGTGHASLSYLRRFPFDKIKIDKSFIRNLQEDPQSVAIVEAVLLLSRRLGLNVVAEGVETSAQLDRLRELRCPLVQGFFKGRPMLAEAARAFFRPAAV